VYFVHERGLASSFQMLPMLTALSKGFVDLPSMSQVQGGSNSGSVDSKDDHIDECAHRNSSLDDTEMGRSYSSF
jgi:hypothetical protein